jgi:hypothetical protein
MPRASLLPAATALAALTAAALFATALSLRPPGLIAAVGAVEAIDSSTGTPKPIVGPTPAPPATARVGAIPVQLETGAALHPTPAPVTTVLLVETGTLSVVIDGRGLAGWGLDRASIDAPLSAGDRLVVVTGARYAVRNDGPTLVEARAVTVVSGDAPEPLPASG